MKLSLLLPLAFLLLVPPQAGAETIKCHLHEAKTSGLKVSGREGWMPNWKPDSWAEWTVSVREAGDFRMIVEYPAQRSQAGTMSVEVDGAPVLEHALPDKSKERAYRKIVTKPGIRLTAGTHRVRLCILEGDKKRSTITIRRVTLASGYSGDYGFIKTGLPLDARETGEAWVKAMTRAPALGIDNDYDFAARMWTAFPLMCDWFLQDNDVHGEWGVDFGYDARGDFAAYLGSPADADAARKRRDELARGLIASVAEDLNINPAVPATLEEQLRLYIDLCFKRRARLLGDLKKKTGSIIYATHHNMGTIYLTTEKEGCPPGSKLRMIHLTDGGSPLRDEVLFDSNNGIVRDPELSFDARRLLFARRKTRTPLGVDASSLAPDTGHYNIYEMDLATRKLRPMTTDETYGADFEPCYLPNGDIIYNSMRCVQEITCGWGEHSNFHIMNKDGKYSRRICYDQTQTGFPHLLNDGRVVFTRRDYNDRGQTYAHALFVMNPDGTFQTEFYGNQTSEPTSIQHTRPIPGTHRVLGVAGGYHTDQGGKLVIVDTDKGRQEYEGTEFLFWDHTKKRTHGDLYAREGEQYSYPYPLDDRSFIVSFEPFGAYLQKRDGVLSFMKYMIPVDGIIRYKLYYMTVDGQREMLAADPMLSCHQGLPVIPRKRPHVRASSVDYTKKTATMFVQNVYIGPGTKGVKPGSIKKVRVIEIYYKPITIGASVWGPPGNQIGPGKKYSGRGHHSVTPVGVGTASFDAKRILGEAVVHEDGSAMFEVPPRTPIYLQLIDDKGYAVQTMRSWATLMPNETFSCVGCHEDKDEAPQRPDRVSIAMRNKPQKLKALGHVSSRSFSYAEFVQPILDKHCVSCHSGGKKAAKIDLSRTIIEDKDKTLRRYYSSYITLLKANIGRDGKPSKKVGPGTPNKWVDYYTRLLTVEPIAPYYAGSARSGLLKQLREGHNKVKLTELELGIISAWIDLNVPFVGDYDEMNCWTDKQKKAYRDKMTMRRKQIDIEAANIRQFIEDGQPQ